MATRNYEGKKIKGALVENTLDALTVEEALQVNVNKKPFTVTMRTPGEDASLVRGLLHSEAIINDANFNPELVLKEENEKGIVTVVNLTVPKSKLGDGYSNSRNLLSVSSCGICGKTELSDLAFMGQVLDDKDKLDINLLHQLFDKMEMFQHDFLESGGTHAAAGIYNRW